MKITEFPPTEPGALSGFSATCERCGMELRSSLRSSLEIDILEHEAWDELRETNHDLPLAARTSFPEPEYREGTYTPDFERDVEGRVS